MSVAPRKFARSAIPSSSLAPKSAVPCAVGLQVERPDLEQAAVAVELRVESSYEASVVKESATRSSRTSASRRGT